MVLAIAVSESDKRGIMFVILGSGLDRRAHMETFHRVRDEIKERVEKLIKSLYEASDRATVT